MEKVFENFDEVVLYLENYTNLEKTTDTLNNKKYRLDRMALILERLGNPEKSFKPIHVAGSKGKGSVSVMLARAINSCNFKCGLYTSPHLVDYRERFTIAGDFIPDSILIKTGEELKSKMAGFSFKNIIPGNENPTSFELYTAFSYMLFKNTHCEYAVIETGMGGRLDATNTLQPVACVLTPVELEHTAVLGNTIELIATEKSKIIKPEAKCFFSYQKPSALNIFKKEAKACNAEYFSLADYVSKIESYTTDSCEKTLIKWKDGTSENLNLLLKGHVQSENAALALLVLKNLGFTNSETIRKAIEEAMLPGHFEKVSEKPDIYIDGAHTVASLTNLISSFKEIHNSKNSTVIFGCLSDKDIDKMTDLVVDNFSRIIIATPGTFKKSNIDSIFNVVCEKTKDTDKSVKLIPDVKQALDFAKKNTPANEAVLVAGSFYLAGDIKLCLK